MQLAHFRDLFEVIMRESQKRHFTVVFDEFQNLYKVNRTWYADTNNSRAIHWNSTSKRWLWKTDNTPWWAIGGIVREKTK